MIDNQPGCYLQHSCISNAGSRKCFLGGEPHLICNLLTKIDESNLIMDLIYIFDIIKDILTIDLPTYVSESNDKKYDFYEFD